MLATIVGNDYFLHLNSKDIKFKGRLETSLLDENGNHLGKIVSVTFKENSGPDGVQMRNTPANARWKDVKSINVTISPMPRNIF